MFEKMGNLLISEACICKSSHSDDYSTLPRLQIILRNETCHPLRRNGEDSAVHGLINNGNDCFGEK